MSFFPKALPDVPSDWGKGAGLMGKYAATQHLERRGHILLFHGIFNSNLRKAFYRRPKRRQAGRKEGMKRGVCSPVLLKDMIDKFK